jgi:hypothetical protein
MTITDDLMARTYPAVLIQRWAGTYGWPAFRVFLAANARHIVPIAGEYATYATAHAEAVEVAACQRTPCPVIDMTQDEG